MILRMNLKQNYNDNSVTANSSLLSPSGGVKSMSPIQQNSMKNGSDENDNYNMSDETTCATNYSICKEYISRTGKILFKMATTKTTITT